jgi:outer membrane murein-binding lipoprotein Lpp
MVGRVENQELNAQLDALRSKVAALRIRIEEPLRHVERGRTPLET